MKIKSTYVTFEQAKLLKEKGFNEPVFYCYNLDGTDKRLDDLWLQSCEGGMSLEDWLIDYNLFHFELVSKPEQWQVIEWLRFNKGLDLWVETGYADNSKKYYPKCTKDGHNKNLLQKMFPFEFKSPQEAYSAAFDYVLKNLI